MSFRSYSSIKRAGYLLEIEDPDPFFSEKELIPKVIHPHCTSYYCSPVNGQPVKKDLKGKPDFCPDCGYALVYLKTYLMKNGKTMAVRDY